MTALRCTAHPTGSAEWLSIEVDTGHPYPLVLLVPSANVTTVPADGSELEQGLIASLLALGHRPAVGAEDRLTVELGEVGRRHALVRVATSAGPVVCRVDLEDLVEG